MKDDGGTRDGGPDERRIGHVALAEIDARRQPPDVSARQVVQDADPSTFVDQFSDQVTSDEAAATGDDGDSIVRRCQRRFLRLEVTAVRGGQEFLVHGVYEHPGRPVDAPGASAGDSEPQD